jgi:hypothetical protein
VLKFFGSGSVKRMSRGPIKNVGIDHEEDSLFSSHFSGCAHIKDANFILTMKINHCDTISESTANSIHATTAQVGGPLE